MRRILVILIATVAVIAAPTEQALALTCPNGEVVWIKATNSSDGTYKHVYWQGGNQYFPGSGTDYINTDSQTNSFVSISSNSSSTSYSEFCVPDGIESAGVQT